MPQKPSKSASPAPVTIPGFDSEVMPRSRAGAVLPMAAEAQRVRRSTFDVTDGIEVTDPAVVGDEVIRLFCTLYQDADARTLRRAFDDFAAAYTGADPRYHASDTPYHDVQHVLDVTLAMARLMAGRESVPGGAPLSERLFRFGIMLALFHDSGYLRRRRDTRHRNGAEYTLTHVSRSGEFLRDYLPRVGMGDLAGAAARVVHYTGYEVPVARIRVSDPAFHELGCMLGTADIRAQMADRCYLEKCYDRLYPEFVLGGVARRRLPQGGEEVVFASAADLITKTPQFHANAARRLEQDLDGVHRHFRRFFRGDDPYLEAIERNVGYARRLGDANDMAGLRRRLPDQAPVAI
ncbi:MAG: hypothetical protein ACREUW_09560 [Burkholderiales bacterium]